PAASRPSRTTTTRRPACLTQSCSLQSFVCSLSNSFSYCLRFSFVSLPLELFVDIDVLRSMNGQSGTIELRQASGGEQQHNQPGKGGHKQHDGGVRVG